MNTMNTMNKLRVGIIIIFAANALVATFTYYTTEAALYIVGASILCFLPINE